MTTRHVKTVRAFTKSVNEETREVEQIVSVFENLDLGRDIVKTGAFTNSLAEWAKSGDPIPAIWSHEWDNPFAHIGYVVEAKELAAGDALLPDEIRDLGGLYTRYKIDTGDVNPFAEQVFHLLKARRVREASFAYDIFADHRNSDGTTDLIDLGLIEIGPTLKGMNPMTQLLAVKSRRANLEAELVKAGLDETLVKAGLDAAAAKSSHTFLPLEEDPTRCGWPGCGLTLNTQAHLNTLSAEDGDGAKARVTLASSYETTISEFYAVAEAYVDDNNMAAGGLYDLCPEGTYPDEMRAVYRIEGWDDPYGGGPFFQFNFETVDDELSIKDYVEVALEVTLAPKARKKAKASIRGTKPAGNFGITEPTSKTEEPDKGKVEDPAGSKSNTGEASRAILELDELELA